jgi:hypothetical protein
VLCVCVCVCFACFKAEREQHGRKEKGLAVVACLPWPCA